MAIKLDRTYTDVGIISAGSGLYVYDSTLQKFVLLIPTSDLPATKGAPETVDKTVLTDSSVTQIEGLQTNDQKEYTYNYHRDNIRRLKKYAGSVQTFLERNGMDFTGEKFTGTLSMGRDAVSVNGVLQGKFYITVNSAEEYPIDDVRDLIAKTAIVLTPLPQVEIEGTGSQTIAIETSEGATVSVSSEASSIATASISNGVITITGVTTGNTLIKLTCSCSGEASSERTIMVSVVTASASLSSIAVTTAPTNTTYLEGQTFNPAGMVVTASFSDSSSRAVTGYTTSPSIALATTDTAITISYTYNGVTKTATQAITVVSA